MILLLGALLFVPRLYVSAESPPEDTQFDIEVHYGFEDTVRIGEHASFHVSLYNKGELKYLLPSTLFHSPSMVLS